MGSEERPEGCNSIDHLENKREQLARTYGAKTDGELEELSSHAAELTETVQEELRTEIARRGLAMQPQQPPEEDRPKWRRPVTLRKFRDLPEAHLAKTILDSAGIRNYLADENLIQMDWFYSNAIGGIKLWVNEEDAETAAALLDAEIPEEFTVQGLDEFKQPRCPHCQSLYVSFEELNKRATFASFFLSLPIPWKRRRWKCNACGKEWRNAGSEPAAP